MNFLLLLSVGCALFLSAGPGQTAEKKKGEPKKAQPLAVSAPEITAITVIRDLGRDLVLQNPLALARDDKNGDLVISSMDADDVVILDKNGALLRRLASEYLIETPYGVALDSKGRIYVSETATGLLKIFSPAGSFEEEFDLSELAGKTVAPGRITLDKDGSLYIADVKNDEIMILDDKGTFVKALGKFKNLQKAGAVEDGRIVGVSAYGKAVQVYNRNGELLHAFGEHGDTSDENVAFPAGYAVDAKGRLWFADAFQHRIQVFSLDGKFLFNYGRPQGRDGGFFFPIDLCFGDNGTLFVLEKGANRIQIFQVGDLVGEKRNKETEKQGNGGKAGN